MIRNYTEAELELQRTSSRKYWEAYKAEREAKRLADRRKIAAAILAYEILQSQEANG